MLIKMSVTIETENKQHQNQNGFSVSLVIADQAISVPEGLPKNGSGRVFQFEAFKQIRNKSMM
jgi:hypothetical protein